MDLKAFKKDILPIKDKLYRFALRITGNPAEAEDVVQEVFIKVWNKRNELGHISNMDAWCMKVVRNLAIDKGRSKHRRTESLDNVFHLKNKEPDPYRLTEVHDTLDKVKGLMEQLNDQQKRVMHLRDIEGMTYKEIAEVMQLSLQQVKVSLFRARRKVKELILKKGLYEA